MENGDKDLAIGPEGERVTLSLLTETQFHTHKMRDRALERFLDDADTLHEVIHAADGLDNLFLHLVRSGKSLERFHSPIMGTPKAATFIAGMLTKSDGEVRETPKDSINSDLSSIIYKESTIRGLWVERVQPKRPKDIPSLSLVGSARILSTQ